MPTRLALADAVVQAAHANLLNALDTGVRVEAARMIHNTAVEELNRITGATPVLGMSAPYLFTSSDPARRPPFQPLTSRQRALAAHDAAQDVRDAEVPWNVNTSARDAVLALYVAALNEEVVAHVERTRISGDESLRENFPFWEAQTHRFRCEILRRFARISNTHSVHAFVDLATGDVYKPGGYTSPQRTREGMLQSRGNISTPEGRAELFARLDIFGGYLYAGRG